MERRLEVPLELNSEGKEIYRIATYSGTPFDCYHYGSEAEEWFSKVLNKQVILTK